MWSHYADKHKGICITFNAMELVNGFHQSVYPVEYVTNFPKVDFMKNHNNSVNQIIKSKSVNWKHEQEFRIVIDKKGTAPLPQRSIREICFGLRTPDSEILKTIRFMRDNGLCLPDVLFFKAEMNEDSYKANYIACNAS